MNPDLNNGDENPYDFIFKQDKPGVAVAGRPVPNKNRQMLIFAAFVGVVLILILVVFSVISSSSKDKATEAISVRSYQSEIIRIVEIGSKNARDVELRKKFVTLSLMLLTDQQRIDGVISAKGVVPTALQLNQAKNSANDKALTDSLQIDNHDEVYAEIVDNLATEYFQAAKAAESAAKTARERETLASVRKNIELIYNGEDDSAQSPPTNNQPATQTPAATEPIPVQ